MKHIYFTITVLFAIYVSGQTFDGIPTGTGYYINKAIPSPSGNDLTNEYFEIRGTTNEVVPSDLYLIEFQFEKSRLAKKLIIE